MELSVNSSLTFNVFEPTDSQSYLFIVRRRVSDSESIRCDFELDKFAAQNMGVSEVVKFVSNNTKTCIEEVQSHA